MSDSGNTLWSYQSRRLVWDCRPNTVCDIKHAAWNGLCLDDNVDRYVTWA